MAAITTHLCTEQIRRHLSKHLQTTDIRIWPVLDSTNTRAKQLADTLPHGAVILAEAQSAGRGRTGRSFYSPGGTGLYMSVLLHPDVLPFSPHLTTVAAAVAVQRAIYSLTGQQTRIKWVNDLFLQGKKVCGILTEGVGGVCDGVPHRLIVGIGVNLSTADFPPELQTIAGALHVPGLHRSELAAAILRELLDPHATDGDLLQHYRAHSLLLGQPVRYLSNGRTVQAVATNINDQGNLVVRLADGTLQVLHSGEVSLGSGNFSE